MALCRVKKVTYQYPEVGEPALDNVSWRVEPGEIVLVTGRSGSGKSTLLRLLGGLVPEFYGGAIAGEYLFEGKDSKAHSGPQLARNIGMVFQDPERQLVMTGVEQELAFGMENLGFPAEEMHARLGEMAGYFGLTPLLGQQLKHLSGGQKQKVLLAAVAAVRPKLLLLDEPTSQLDNETAEELMQYLQRLNRDAGVTIVISEQRLDRVMPIARRVTHMDAGRVAFDGSSRDFIAWAASEGVPLPEMFSYFAHVGVCPLPVSLDEGRKALAGRVIAAPAPPARLRRRTAPSVLEAEGLCAGYSNDDRVLNGINLKIERGEFVSVLGNNGAGKSTLLKALCGLLPSYSGAAKVLDVSIKPGCTGALAGKVAYLSQHPNDYLFQDTVKEELLFTLKNLGLPPGAQVDSILRKLDLWEQRDRNPRDLSGGQRQRAALAAVLAGQPQLLLLDEPTRGLDLALKAELGRLMHRLRSEGITVLLVTHDVEFLAAWGERIVVLSEGKIAADGYRHQVLDTGSAGAPLLSRLFHPYGGGILTCSEALAATGGKNYA